METDQPTPDNAGEHGAPDAQEGHEAEDETRRKFRELLARKQERGHLGGAANKAVQHPHAAPAKRGRTFRRKSG